MSDAPDSPVIPEPQPSIPAPPVRILALCDQPVLIDGRPPTGFGRVARNLFTEWKMLSRGAATPEIDVWAIGFDGHGYETCPDWRLLPAGGGDWCSAKRLSGFLRLLSEGDYTHVFILMDLDPFTLTDFPRQFQAICKSKGIRSLLYFPVDAPIEPHWAAMVQAVDVAVSYTEYGRGEVRRALAKSLYPVEVLPHGMDPVFRPLPAAERAEAREIEYEAAGGKVTRFLKPGDFLLVSVNKNEWRKDPLRSLEILKGLIDQGLPAKLMLRMAPQSAMGGCELESAGRQLGLVYGKDWVHVAAMEDEGLVRFYNAADLYLTTSTGEGWGLGVTEALACGTPVALALHTSHGEIVRKLSSGHEWSPLPAWAVALPQEEGFTTFSLGGQAARLRRRVDLVRAVERITEWYEANERGGLPRVGLAKESRACFSWPRIAREMWAELVKP